jgi:hypothetical protein
MRTRTLLLLTVGLLACNGQPGDELPEPTTFEVTVVGIAPNYPYFTSGGVVLNAPLGASESQSVQFYAPPGMKLSFACMYLPSNDLFFAPMGAGLELFDSQGQPIVGDRTSEAALWDAGTEVDQTLGQGEAQPANQAAPNQGEADSNPNVRLAQDTYPDLPAVDTLIGVIVESGPGNLFTLTIENRGTERLGQGVFVVHPEENPLFTAGESQRAEGLESLAEDADPTSIIAALASQSGVVSPLAPGLWIVHAEPNELFAPGEADYGRGLESLAEDGDPTAILDDYADANIGIFGGIYGEDVLPVLPGGGFTFEIEARPGDRFTFVSMFAQSNDWFVSNSPEGVELFDPTGTPVTLDLADQLALWDAGTELGEYPGAGPHQAPRQSAANTGEDEEGVVRPPDDPFPIPVAAELVQVTITPK